MLGFYKVFFTFCAVLVGLVFAVMGFWNLLLVMWRSFWSSCLMCLIVCRGWCANGAREEGCPVRVRRGRVAVRAGCRLCGVRFRGSGRLLGLG